LADQAGVPVRDVLVADASRRTTKHNAYVSGIGKTRRVVVWDTLLDRGEPGEVRLVVAHELGHRRFRHVAIGTAIAMSGTALFVLGLWVLFQWDRLLAAIGADGPGDPRVIRSSSSRAPWQGSCSARSRSRSHAGGARRRPFSLD
jgi:STE24 endopeptidase